MPLPPDYSSLDAIANRELSILRDGNHAHSYEDLVRIICELEFYKNYLEYKNYSEEDYKKFKKNFKKIRG